MKIQAFCLILSILVLGCQTSSAELNGELLTVDGFRVLRVWGTHYQMGYAHGYLLASDIMDIAKNYLFTLVTPAAYESQMLPLYRSYLEFPAPYVQELSGLFDGMSDSGVNLFLTELSRDLTIDDIGAMNSLVDVLVFSKSKEQAFGLCSSICGWGSGTDLDSIFPGGTLHCRDLDWTDSPSRTLGRLSIVIAFESELTDEDSWVSVGFPGFIGCLSGMDQNGIGATLDVGNHEIVPATGSGIVPICVQVRRGIELTDANADGKHDASDVYYVMESLERVPSTIVHTFGPAMIEGSMSPPSLVVESNSTGIAQRNPGDDPDLAPYFIAATNHHRVLYTPDPCDRYATIKTMVAVDYKIDRTEAWEIEKTVRLPWTVQTMLFSSDTRELYVATRSDATPAPFKTPAHMTWEQLFPNEPTWTPSPTPAASTPTPDPSSSPSPTPTPVATSSYIDLQLSSSFFNQNDPFVLTSQVYNMETIPVDLELWILLDVQGLYWFYPSWSSIPEWEILTFEPGLNDIMTIMSFQWPKVEQHLDNLFFWGAVLIPETHELAGDYDYVQFGF